MGTASFQLSKATISDLPEITELMYHCFDSWITTRFMGCFSIDDVPKAVARYTRIMNEDPTDIWMKVVDTQTGKIAAASNWKLYLGSEKAIKRQRKEPPEWLSNEVKEEAEAIAKPVNDARAASNPHPFLCKSLVRGCGTAVDAGVDLNTCFTAEGYWRRGAGSMMVTSPPIRPYHIISNLTRASDAMG